MQPSPTRSKFFRRIFGTCFALASGLLLAACETTETHGPASSPPAIIAASTPAQAWVLRHGGRSVGALVRFEEQGSQRFLYSVRDNYGLDRGIVDSEGRAWRFVPHAEPVWTGTGTVLVGAGSILDLSAAPSMHGVELDALPKILEASVRR